MYPTVILLAKQRGQAMSEPSTSPFVFLSYSRADGEFVTRLRTDLQAQGIEVWIDKEGIQPGTPDWEQALRTAIRSAHAVLFIASPHARSSRYIKDELRLAEMYQRSVYPIWMAGTHWMDAVPIGWGGTQYIDARDACYQTALPDIVRALRRSLEETTAKLIKPPEMDFEPRNPYKGLRAFTSEDAHDFFGREKLIGEFTDILEEKLIAEKKSNPDARLLVVVGPSGSGKSSVVMAGLLPALQTGSLPGSKQWVYLDPIVPGKYPIQSLTEALWAQLPAITPSQIRATLEDDSTRGLHLIAAFLARQQGKKVVLVVDQFEELFTQTTNEHERRRFIDLLMTAITDPLGPVILILTLRADFDDRPMQYPALGKLLEAHRRPVFPMELEDLRAVIEKPAKVPDVQLTFEGDLVGDLLFEVQGQVGALPLLQFTLDQLFQQRSGHLLTLRAYREIGGVKGALAKQAESTYAGLPSEAHRALTRVLFLRLIDPGQTEQDTTRRRAALSELTLSDPTQTRILQETANTFIAARLLTTSTVAGIPTVEVSHEALIREWARLADSLVTNRSDILLQQAISEDAMEWIRRGRPTDRLYRGTQLSEAQAWAERNVPSIDEVTFLQTSAVERERQENAERVRQARELNLQQQVVRRQRYVIGLVGVISAVLVVALVVTVVLYTNLQRSLPVTVTNSNDNGPGSLREAIVTASPNSTITFAKDLKSPITLTSGELKITKNLIISGSNAHNILISGNHTSGVFNISTDISVTISNLAIINGSGSAIFNSATLALINILLSNNHASRNGGAIFNADGGVMVLINASISGNTATTGGGIFNSSRGVLKVVNTTISDNHANRNGGGIYNLGDLTFTKGTVSGNTAGEDGGGIYNPGDLTFTKGIVSGNTAGEDGGGISIGTSRDASGNVMLTNSTVSGNTADKKGGGIIDNSDALFNIVYCTIYNNTAQAGGGIANEKTQSDFGELQVFTSIVAGNHANRDPDVLGTLNYTHYDLIQDITGAILAYDDSTNLFGPSPRLDAQHIDLGPLQNNGGPTQTYALLSGSPAIDQIPAASTLRSRYIQDKTPPGKPCETYFIIELFRPSCTSQKNLSSGGPRIASSGGPPICGEGSSYDTDQRGITRPQGSACDIGAYE